MSTNGIRNFDLRQIALVAENLDAVVSDLTEVLDLVVCFADPGVEKFGLKNALMAFGGTFLEVVAPKQSDTSAGRLLEKRKGDGGYMVIVQTDDLAAQKKRLASKEARIVWESDLEQAKAVHLHPKDIGGAILSFDQMTPPESWHWGGPDWQEKQGSGLLKRISGAVLQSAHPQAMARRWGEIFGLAAEEAGAAWVLRLNQGEIRFVVETDGRGPGVAGVVVESHDIDGIKKRAQARNLSYNETSVLIGGTRFYFSD